VKTPRSIGSWQCWQERKTRMPETGSLRDRITTCTRWASAALKASSL
jgi:hypothetical protein